MKRIFLLLFLLIGFQQAYAQKTITGTVTDETGDAIPGVSVVVKETTVGTMTLINGTYSIDVPDGSNTLIFSYISMETQEVVISSNVVDVSMASSSEMLDEVVVTALGIKKAKKSLGYSVENLKSDELTAGNQANMVNALQGKVAGVTVTNSGGSPGGSSVIMIRGGSSLSGNNQPLFVVDGIPIDNSTISQSAGDGSMVASSNRALDLNSEDIENVTILKGPAAAALYGIKAANGAVIVTTKSGKPGKAQISYNGFFSYDQVSGIPEIQTEYGLGTLRSSGIDYFTTLSWDTAKLAADVPRYTNLENFFQPALSYNHNVSYSGGTEKSTYYASVGRLDNGGVIEGTKYSRTSFKMKVNSSLTDKIKVANSFNYVNSVSDRTRQGSTSAGSFRSILNYPINVDMTDYLDEDGNQQYTDSTLATFDNPYWSIDNNPIQNRVNRYIGITSISYDPFQFLNITYRLGADMFFEEDKRSYAWSSLHYNTPTGYIGEYDASNRILTSTLIASSEHKINSNTFGITLGHNIEEAVYSRTKWTGENFIEPDFVGINNILQENRNISQYGTKKRIISAFGEFKYDWKGLIFFNATGRMDWSSTLPKNRNEFFYPSVGTSVVISDILKDIGVTALSSLKIDYLNIRSTWAQVGKDAPPHVLATPMASSTNTYTIDPQGFFRSVWPTGNPSIRPEFTSSFEIGSDMRLFGNRLLVDFTYFNEISSDQILFVRMPPSASTFGGYLNLGTIEKDGIEILLQTHIIKRKDFNWNVDINFAKINHLVTELPGEIKQVENSDSWAYNGIAEGAAILDGPVFGIYGSAYERTDDGTLILDSDGMVQEASLFSYLGDRYPKWAGGISNRIQYKNLSLNFLVDITYGNEVVNGTKAAMINYGLDPITLNRGDSVLFEGVIQTGTDTDGNPIYEENDQYVTLDQEYYQKTYIDIGENFVEDGSWVRLRYVTLSYNLPKKWFGDKISGIKLNATARNLLMFTNYSGVDPEVNTIGAAVSGTGSIGIDNLGTPSTKGFDFSLRITF